MFTSYSAICDRVTAYSKRSPQEDVFSVSPNLATDSLEENNSPGQTDSALTSPLDILLFVYRAVGNEMTLSAAMDELTTHCKQVDVFVLYGRNMIGGHISE
ncbi:hypothetical protein F4779DRAFT_617862 [Xylariaceae sp. FL0662B]|nr:hypothetical protein F4779DRAFT_617862 [Xylariaceae sp. FL0662B]